MLWKRVRNSAAILNISYDAMLLQTRSAILRAAGHVVSPAETLPSALGLLRRNVFDVVIIGHSIPPAHTRALLAATRAFRMPALLLTREAEPASDRADMILPALEGPMALLDAVDALLHEPVVRHPGGPGFFTGAAG